MRKLIGLAGACALSMAAEAVPVAREGSRELARNPGFEDAAGCSVSGWTIKGGRAEIAPGEGRHGSAALFIDKAEPGAAIAAVQDLQLDAGGKYSVNVFVRTYGVKTHQVNLDGPNILVTHYNAAGKAINEYWGWPVADSSGGWARITVYVDSSANAARTELRLFVPSSVSGRVWFDDVTVRERFDPDEPKPERSRCAAIDGFNRLVVDGKPYFPLGMYFEKWDPLVRENLDVYSKGPFNCVVPYSFPDKAAMDLCAERGLKVVYNANVYFGTRWAFGLVKSECEEDEWVTRTVNALKGHPALLAWYVNDEFNLGMRDRLLKRYELVRRLDPLHATWGVYMSAHETPWYLDAQDVLGVDPYPIRTRQADADLSSVWQHPHQAVGRSGGKRAVWSVIQAFDFGGYIDDMLKAGTRAPTREELSGMSWMAVAGGANGLFYLAYTALSQTVNGATFGQRWADVCAVAQEIKDREQLLLSEPGVAVKAAAAPFAVRTWRQGLGDVALVVNMSRTNAVGRIAFADDAKLDVSLPPLAHRFMAVSGK